MSTSTYCLHCKHYEFGLRCPAFPEEIPDDIFTGEVEHDQMRSDQEGECIFTPIDQEDE